MSVVSTVVALGSAAASVVRVLTTDLPVLIQALTKDERSHYFPMFPRTMGLHKSQCYYCHEHLPRRPKDGCTRKRLATSDWP
jgi:hypothetical protein